MTKITLNDLSSISGNEASAIATINTNNAILETASDNTISRDGTSPNQMLASLDMNSNSLLNLPAPSSATEPIRLQDLTSLNTIGLAPSDAAYVTLATHSVLTNERVLTAGTNMSFTDAGPGSTLTISNTGSGAPTNVSYLTLGTDTSLTNERVLTAGSNITFVDGGAGSTLTINGAASTDTTQWIRLTSTYTLTSQTAAQKLFNSSTNGAVTLSANTLYEFECEFDLSSMSSTIQSFGFAIGGTATISRIRWASLAYKSALTSDTSVAIPKTFLTASNTAITDATTSPTGAARIRGLISITTGGTIIPQVSLGIAAAAVVGINSFFKIKPLGTDTQTTQGTWT